MGLQTLGDNILIKLKDPEITTRSGIILTNAKNDKPEIADVVAVGPEISGIDPGNRVLTKKYSGTPVEYEGIQYLSIKESDIIAVFV